MSSSFTRTKPGTGLRSGLAGLCLALLAGSAALAQSAFDANKEVALPGWQLDFQNINPAIKFATAYGDRSKGAHGTFGTFPPGFTTPWHIHSAAYHGVVVKGVMSNPFKGQDDPPTMEPGSYWYVPAEYVHTTSCVSKIPCMFYFNSDKAFDFTVVE